MSKVKVLFLCTHNSARSQMAEGLLRHLYGERYEVFSAGVTPTKVNLLAVKVMAEIGIDISKQHSKSLAEFQGKQINLVVSVCKSSPKTTCALCSSPIITSKPQIIEETLPEAKRYLHNPFSDPSEVEGTDEQKLAAFRRVRDDIRTWIRNYFANLGV
jgi:arsenate reductase (thioredoxin)